MKMKSGNKRNSGSSASPFASAGCCKVDALLSIDERGQMVLPKELRDRANIRAGDKLAAVTWERDGQVCCVCLIKAEGLTEMIRNLLGPMMKNVLASGSGGVEK